MNIRIPALAVALSFATAFSCNSQSPAPSPVPIADEQKSADEAFKKMGAQTSGVGKIGSEAEITVPQGFIFFPSSGAQTMLREMGNLISGKESGLIINNETRWLVAFEFKDDGYVKDDEKDKLDADAILKSMQDSEPAINARLKSEGLPAQHFTGFSIPPHYNEETKSLEWAIRFTTEGRPGETVNHFSKVLGRRGVMEVTLACSPEKLNSVLPEFRKLMENYTYVPGETYAEYKKGDKLATYGLIGAVAGGAAFAAAKGGLFGFLAKGGKAVILGIVAVFAGIVSFFKKLFGRKKSPYQS
jgi:uncharacterized membrane-anchored protein